VPEPKAAPKPKAAPRKAPTPQKPPPVGKTKLVQASDLAEESTPPPTHSPPSYLKPPSPVTAKPEAKARLSSFFSKKEREPRDIHCFECRAAHTISPSSTSTLCPKCGTYISLKDYEINERWNRRIQTRGDVLIQKKGVVSGTTIQCHHLILEGDFTGGVECSGDLIIRRNGKIMGKVICRKLIVEKRANVEFLNSVETDECVLDGLISGNIHCKGLLTLKKKAVLTGNIKVGRLSIAEGAQHHGQIQMGS